MNENFINTWVPNSELGRVPSLLEPIAKRREREGTTFENGGVLTINISVGHAEAAGSFDLFDGNSELPTEGAPENALASVYGVPPGGTQKITYTFNRGQHFKFGATGDWFSEQGSVNAFVAKISVEPALKEKN